MSSEVPFLFAFGCLKHLSVQRTARLRPLPCTSVHRSSLTVLKCNQMWGFGVGNKAGLSLAWYSRHFLFFTGSGTRSVPKTSCLQFLCLQAFQLERFPPIYKIPSLFLKTYLHRLKNYICSCKYPSLERMKSCLTWGIVHPTLTLSICFGDSSVGAAGKISCCFVAGITSSCTHTHSHTFLAFL